MSAESFDALSLSIRVAVLATALDALIGIPLAYLLARRRFRGKTLVDLLVTLPLVLPPTVTGFYLIVLLGRRGWLGAPLYAATGLPIAFSWTAAAIAATVMALPLLVRTARAALECVDRDFERAAHPALVRRAPDRRPAGCARVVTTPRLDVAVVKHLPGFTIDVHWTAGDGVAVLFGPSGAGKSLTLACLSGLVRPDAGRIVVDGQVLFDASAGIDVPPQRRRVGYVFQSLALFPHL